jgi:hypothetical protein
MLDIFMILDGSTAQKYSKLKPHKNNLSIDHLNGTMKRDQYGLLSFASSLNGWD